MPWDSSVGEKCEQVGPRESWVLLDSPRFGHDWALYVTTQLDRLFEHKTERTEPLLLNTTLSRANVDIDQQHRKFGGNDTYTTTLACCRT